MRWIRKTHSGVPATFLRPAVLGLVAVLAGCGGEPSGPPADAGIDAAPGLDAGVDAGADAAPVPDAGGDAAPIPDAGLDAAPELDAAVDAAPEFDAAVDAAPEFDAAVDAAPELDAAPDAEPDTGVLTCGSCHGTETDPAPPPDTTGETATTARGVGAHQSHLLPADWRADVPCTECHVVPSAVDSPGHIDGDGVAEVTFGDRATEEGATPSWSGVSCSGAYCHGATLSGGTMTTPVWTTVDGTQVVCGSCHSLPPTEDHPAIDQCYICHDSVVDESLGFIDPALHINGEVDF